MISLMGFVKTCGYGCALQTMFVPFLLGTCVLIFFVSKTLGKTISIVIIAVEGAIPWGLGALGYRLGEEHFEKMTPTIDPSLLQQAHEQALINLKLVWTLPIYTSILAIIFIAIIAVRSPTALPPQS